VTFDCYGTLIDWNAGIRAELERVFGDDVVDDADGPEEAEAAEASRSERIDGLLARYHELERELEKDRSLTYREVMTRAMQQLGAPAGLESGLAESLPTWQPFPEVPAALAEIGERGWKLAILSNTDRDYIDASLRLIGVPFDHVIVASEIGSYKPGHRHWRVFGEQTGADRAGRVHVGASLFHDVAPAIELGLPTIWINRLGEEPEPQPDVELRTLDGLGRALDSLVA